MSYLFLLVYICVCCWLLLRIRFVQNAGLSAPVIAGLFLVKAGAGILNGWIVRTYKPAHSDTIVFYKEGWQEYQLLLHDPKAYIENIFVSPYSKGYGGFFETHASFWNNLRDNIIIKLVSVFDLFSFGDFYINIVLYNFLTFFGAIALYRVFSHYYPGKKWMLVIACFLLPSLLFFGSIIHREGLMLALTGALLLNIDKALHVSGFTLKRIGYLLLLLLLIFLMRSFVLMALLPALTAWIIAEKRKKVSSWIFAIVYLLSGVCFFNLHRLVAVDPPQVVVNRQSDFLHLPQARSYIQTDTLQSAFGSFAAHLPQALEHAILRPYFSDRYQAAYLLPFALETDIYKWMTLLFCVAVLFRKIRMRLQSFHLFSILFSLTGLLLIGYIVPVLGAIIRYRVVFMPFLLAPVLCGLQSLFRNQTI